MRPTLTEQLAGLSRILADVIRPELADPYPKDILDGVCGALDAIAAGWHDVAAFLEWDAGRTEAVLEEALATSPSAFAPDMAAQIHELLARQAEVSDRVDLAGLQERQREARQVLAAATGTIADRDELAGVRSAVTALMRERAARYPVKPVWRPATPLTAAPAR